MCCLLNAYFLFFPVNLALFELLICFAVHWYHIPFLSNLGRKQNVIFGEYGITRPSRLYLLLPMYHIRKGECR